MNNQFKAAFESIHATNQLKENTYNFVQRELSRRRKKPHVILRYATICCAMLLVFLCCFGGYRFYVTPVSYISVDVNPSVELGLNRLDHVVTVTAYNEDGDLILQNLDLKNKSYTEAIELLLANETFGRYLTNSSLLSFTVVSDKEEALLAGIQQCHGYTTANTECHSANSQLMEDAHHSGLSFGKYQAFLELSQYDNTITAKECQTLSMRKIRDLISQYQIESDTPSQTEDKTTHHGKGNRHGNGYSYHGGTNNWDD